MQQATSLRGSRLHAPALNPVARQPAIGCPAVPRGLGPGTAHIKGLCNNHHALYQHVALSPRLCPSKQHQSTSQPARTSTVARFGLDTALLATSTPAVRDVACMVVCGLAARVWTKIFSVLVENGLLEQKLSRKLVHTTTGPLFLLTWPLFSANPWARVFASVVPCINAARLLAVGLGFVKDDKFVGSVSRSGDRGELLKGPLYYCIVLIATTLLCWRHDPSGMVAVCLMCGGDGLADIVGRRWGTAKLPYNTSKSWAGSMAMLVGGALMAAGLISLFCSLGYFECYSPSVLLPYLLAISGAATVVESLPINQVLDDNLSVPVVAAGAALLLMPHAAHAAAAVMVAL